MPQACSAAWLHDLAITSAIHACEVSRCPARPYVQVPAGGSPSYLGLTSSIQFHLAHDKLTILEAVWLT